MNKILEGMKLIQEGCEAIDDFSKCKDCPFFKICKRLRALGKQEFNDDGALIPEWWFDWDDS